MIVYQNNFNIEIHKHRMELKHIYLKVPGDSKDIVENYRTKYSGKMDTRMFIKIITIQKHKTNLENLVRISVDIILPNPNFNLYKL
jgi:hypothetical protein